MPLPPHIQLILWDTDLKTFYPLRHKTFLITRVAEKGNWSDVRWLRKQFSLRIIKQTIARSRNTSPKTKNFWKLV
jgi:hypothetical protein